jgi:hypothetical protein
MQGHPLFVRTASKSYFMYSISFFLLLLISICSSATVDAGNNEKKSNITASECTQAIELAERVLLHNHYKLDEYKIIKIENLILQGKQYKGSEFWSVVMKKKSLIPDGKNDIIGAGGEIFIKVDLKRKTASIIGFGE